MAQPAAAWSNLGFVLAGALILARRDPGAMGRFHADVYGLTVVFLGLGSAFFHATLTFAGQWCDVLSMYLFPSYLVLYNLSRLGRLKPRGFLAAYLLVNGFLAAAYALGPRRAEIGKEVFALLVLALAASEWRLRARLASARDARWLWAGAGSFAAAFGIWVLDAAGLVCSPRSPLQGHALWHLLCALATWCLYRYYASERSPRLNAAPGEAILAS